MRPEAFLFDRQRPRVLKGRMKNPTDAPLWFVILFVALWMAVIVGMPLMAILR